jgi:hypothetical protein
MKTRLLAHGAEKSTVIIKKYFVILQLLTDSVDGQQIAEAVDLRIQQFWQNIGSILKNLRCPGFCCTGVIKEHHVHVVTHKRHAASPSNIFS